MRCKSSGLNFKQLTLDNGPFNKDKVVFSLGGAISSRGKPGRSALHAGTSSLFIAGHDAIGHGDISNFPSLSQLFLIL